MSSITRIWVILWVGTVAVAAVGLSASYTKQKQFERAAQRSAEALRTTQKTAEVERTKWIADTKAMQLAKGRADVAQHLAETKELEMRNRLENCEARLDTAQHLAETQELEIKNQLENLANCEARLDDDQKRLANCETRPVAGIEKRLQEISNEYKIISARLAEIHKAKDEILSELQPLRAEYEMGFLAWLKKPFPGSYSSSDWDDLKAKMRPVWDDRRARQRDLESQLVELKSDILRDASERTRLSRESAALKGALGFMRQSEVDEK